ncbi:nicotinate-nucleotide adenylyltransferase [Actibacterium mucosum KCTC 23349]|uniref:Probable nicotinate-nucleotide adenylyltransferase n=1 Tax=Actibacterium mucosum KCTC 23349 TaxID=1454373 RepID=A0A037ZLC0_9RHOB|nr:nicotinate-nucleotide adenylyltransferase [Actibacterium mucosum]KAJ56399.1 nicotinate-nucleotide adenylyltransferase [Actibacterium mucosum KCTC 23349]
MKHGLPYARRGQVIGLLGGSFDPAHDGHAHITREAMKRFGLDQVWWLVSPGNPLKPHGPAPMGERLERARKVMQHPRVKITDIEAKIGTVYTAQTLEHLKRMYPGVHFVWLMGADNLASFHHWEAWDWIITHVQVGILARPGQRISARMSKAARKYGRFRLKGRKGHLLAGSAPPAWAFVNVPMSDMSSTRLRAEGQWKARDKSDPDQG